MNLFVTALPVKKSIQKIRRFFECSKYKNKISTDNGEAYAELF